MRGHYDFSDGKRGLYVEFAILDFPLREHDSAVITTQQLVEKTREHAGKLFKTLAPSADPMPIAAFLLPGGFGIIDLPIALFRSGPTKDILGEMIATVVRAEKARAVCMMVMQWGKKYFPKTQEEAERLKRTPVRQHPSLANDPDAKELLALMVFDREGEQHHHAWVKRHAHRHPTLGPWDMMPVPPKQSRFGEFIMPALSANG